MQILIKLLPWLLIAYGFWGGYGLYEEKIVKAEELEGEFSALKTKLKKLEKTKKDIESYYSDRDVAKENMEKVSKDFELAQKKLPEKQDDRANIQLFQEIAKEMLIKGVKITVGRDVSKSGYTEKSYTFNGTGTYLQFLLFFESLYKRDQLFDVKDILFRTVKVQELGRFQAVEGQFDIKTYVYNGSFEKKDTGGLKK